MTSAALPMEDGDPAIRMAARREAGRAGLELGPWLDRVMAEHAAVLGIGLMQLDADQRIEAVKLRLARTAGSEHSPSIKPRAGVVPDTADEGLGRDQPIRDGSGRDDMTSVAQSRQSFEDKTMHEDTADWIAPNGRRGGRVQAAAAPQPQRTVGAPLRRAAQRQEIESKLTSLFKALDRTPRRTDHAVSADADPDGEAGTHLDTLLGETAISPAWRLNKAVGEIADRQAFLERQAAAEGMSPAAPRPPAAATRFATPHAAAADMRRRFEPPHAFEGETHGDLAFTAPASPLATSVPSVFSALQGDIARLARRLDAVGGDVVRRSPGSARKQPSVEDIRALLDEMRPDASIETLGRQVEGLAAKLDQISAQPVPAESIDHLSRRIEAVYGEVSARLSAQPAAPVIDMKAMERLLGDLMARTDRPTPDLHVLERAISNLAAKLDQTERPQGEPAPVLALKAEVGTLAERLDKNETGLLAIVAMERSMGDLFTQIGQMQSLAVQAAENTARAAIQETVTDTVQASRADARLAEARLAATDAAVGRVSQDLAAFRTNRDDADRQLQSILSALNSSLEKVVDRLGALEGDEVDEGIVPDAVSAPVPAPAKPRPSPPAGLPSKRMTGEPLDLAMPIEPGLRLPATADGPDPTSFIAAARRAAQNATAEQIRQAGEAAASRGHLDAAVASSQWFKTGRASKRRPLLLALASLTLLAGVVEVVRTNMRSHDAGVVRPADDQTHPDVVPSKLTGEAKAPDDMAASPPQATANAVPPPPEALPDARPAPANPEPQVAAGDHAGAQTETVPPLSAPIVAAPPLAAPPDAASAVAAPLPTMAMGPRANIAAMQAADLAGKAAAAGLIPAGLRAEADAGLAAAQYEIGLRYADGRGVARDLAAAAGWFDKAARQGVAPAAYRLGSAYEKGFGLPRDAAQSILWYGKAADAGNVRAMHNLAVMLAEGANGKPDYAAASAWFIKAADAGVRDSQYNLAVLYARGMGVEQDLRRADTWFAIAAAQGDTESAKKRDDIEARLDAEAIAAARKAAADFRPAVPVAAANEVPAPAGGWDGTSAFHPTAAPLIPKLTAKDHLGKL